MTICRTCKEDKPDTSFWMQSNKLNRYKDCAQCMYQKRKLYPPEMIARHAQQRTDWRKKIKDRLIEYFGGKCHCCNQSFHQNVFDFHHLDPAVKEGKVNTFGSFEKCLEEAKKCILVCANCHRLIHAGEIKVGPDMGHLEKYNHG